MKGKDILKPILYLLDACAFVSEDCQACGGCPFNLSGCFREEPLAELLANGLMESDVDAFLNYAYTGEAEAYQYTQELEQWEMLWEEKSFRANLERGELSDD